jgi:crossover junction endodeoxyribonuclease RuvC
MGQGTLWVNAPAVVLVVDPGLSGAACKLGGGVFQVLRDFKTLPDIARAIQTLAPGVTHAVMENVHAMPGQGVCSMFSFGRAAGVADGAFALSLPALQVEQVAPQRWQNYFRAQLGLAKGELFDSPAIASKIFPASVPYLKRKKDHNTADAILMALWKLQSLDVITPRV